VSAEVRRNRPDTWLAAIWTLLLRIAVLVALGYILYRVKFIIIVVLVSVMLALAMAPVVDWLQRSRLLRALPRHTRRNVATTLVFVLLGIALVELTILTVRPLAAEIRSFAANWSTHQTQLEQWFATVRVQYEGLPPDIRKWLDGQGLDGVSGRISEQLHHVVLATLESGMLLVELILIPVLAFSFLTESRPLKREVLMAVSRGRTRDVLYVLRQTGVILQSYAVGQLILALIAGVVTWLLLTVLGVRYALVLGVVAAVTRVIPVIGPLVGGIPIVVLSALQGWDRALVVLIAFTIMHLLESKVVMPRLIGYRIKLHPAVVIIVLLVGAEFFGMWGMFLAAPVAAVIKVIFHHFYVRPRLREGPPRRTPDAPPARKDVEVGHPAVAGLGTRSGAHGVHPGQQHRAPDPGT
jgi:predicted PurR-regulated permease PerM